MSDTVGYEFDDKFYGFSIGTFFLNRNALRSLLKEATVDIHDRLDHAFGALDLTTRAGYGVFLSAQAGALDAVLPICARLGDLPSLAPLRPLIACDMESLGAPRAPCLAMRAQAHPLGAYYVVAGSRLGAQILARRVQGSGDPAVRAATMYLSDRSALDAWRAWLAVAGTVEVGHDRIVEGALATFALYEGALAAVTKEMPEHV